MAWKNRKSIVLSKICRLHDLRYKHVDTNGRNQGDMQGNKLQRETWQSRNLNTSGLVRHPEYKQNPKSNWRIVSNQADKIARGRSNNEHQQHIIYHIIYYTFYSLHHILDAIDVKRLNAEVWILMYEFWSLKSEIWRLSLSVLHNVVRTCGNICGRSSRLISDFIMINFSVNDYYDIFKHQP